MPPVTRPKRLWNRWDEVENPKGFYAIPDKYGGDWNARNYDAWLKHYADKLKQVWENMPAMAKFEGIDLMTGKSVDLDLQQPGGRCAITDIPIRPAPLAIRWQLAPAAPAL